MRGQGSLGVTQVSVFFAVAALACCTAQLHEWNNLPVITPTSSKIPSGSQFGSAVSLSPTGMTLAVGVPYDDIYGIDDNGSVLVYTKNEDSFKETSKIVQAGLERGGYFGSSVAATDDWIAIGATNMEGGNGLMYAFYLKDSKWVQDMGVIGLEQSRLGGSVVIQRNLFISGGANFNNGQGYIKFCQHNGFNDWSYFQGIETLGTLGLGSSLAANDKWIVAGSPKENSGRGAAYAFQIVTFGYDALPVDFTPFRMEVNVPDNSNFGSSAVVISNTTLAVGCASNCNAIFVMTFSSQVWSLNTTLFYKDSQNLGTGLSFSSGFLVAGDFGSAIKQVVVFSLANATLFEPTILAPETGVENTVAYGRAVSGAGLYAIVCDPLYKTNNANNGAVFPFKFGDVTPPAPSRSSGDDDKALKIILGILIGIGILALLFGVPFGIRKAKGSERTIVL